MMCIKMTKSRSDEPTDEDIVTHLFAIGVGVNPLFYRFVLEQVAFNLQVSEKRVLSAVIDFINDGGLPCLGNGNELHTIL